jgi:hypothetical protein
MRKLVRVSQISTPPKITTISSSLARMAGGRG